MKETYRSRQERRIPAWDPHMQLFYHFYSLLNNASYLRGVKQSKIFKGYLYVPANLYQH